MSDTTPVGDLTPYAGTYRSNQLRVDVSVVDGQLEENVTYEPLDDVQERIFTGFAGGSFPFPPRRFVPFGKDLFAPAGMPLRRSSGSISAPVLLGLVPRASSQTAVPTLSRAPGGRDDAPTAPRR